MLVVAVRAEGKRDFATRLSPETLAQLDELVRRGEYKTRTAAIEAAVTYLYEARKQEDERLLQAFEKSCGVLHLGVDRERWRAAELERLEIEAGHYRDEES